MPVPLHTPSSTANDSDERADESTQVDPRRRPENVPVTRNREPQNEPAIAVHRLNPDIMVSAANDYRTSGGSRIGIYRSTDGGQHWMNTLPSLPPGHRNSGDPVVLYGYPDLFLVGGAAYKDPENDSGGSIIVYRSEDDGATFGPPIIIQEGFDRQTFNDKPWFALDTAPASPYQGRVYVAYTRFMNPNTVVFFQQSEDGGLTWSEPIRLTEIEPFSLGTFIAIGPMGEVYVAWTAEDGRTSLVFRRSLDGGETFDPPVTIARFTAPPVERGLTEFVSDFTFRVFTFAFLGVDTTTGPGSGRIYAVWHQIRRTSRTSETVDVMISISNDGGCSWSRPRKATDTPDQALSFFPFITVSPTTGTAYIAYYSNRVVQDRLDVFLVRAEDHGCQVAADERVTNISFDPNADPLGVDFIGDYIGAAALPHKEAAVIVWTDTRRSNEDIFAAPVA